MKKKFLLVLCFLAISFIIFLIISNIIYNDNTLISATKKVKNITFTDAKIREEETGYSFYVKLTPSEDTSIARFDAVIIDKDDNIVDVLEDEVGDLKANESKEFKLSTDRNIKKGYSVNYTIYEK